MDTVHRSDFIHWFFKPFFARSCLGKILGKQINVQDEFNKAKQTKYKLRITNYKLKSWEECKVNTGREPTSTYTAEMLWSVYPQRGDEAECKLSA